MGEGKYESYGSDVAISFAKKRSKILIIHR